MYACFVVHHVEKNGWTSQSSTPTFYLNACTQMIENTAQAVQIVKTMLEALGVDLSTVDIHVTPI